VGSTGDTKLEAIYLEAQRRIMRYWDLAEKAVTVPQRETHRLALREYGETRRMHQPWGGCDVAKDIGRFAAWCAFCWITSTGYAQNLDALKAIPEAADRICGIVATSGEYGSAKVTGAVDAALSTLLKKLGNFGVSGAGEISSGSYQGLIQSELPTALKDLRECKLKVFLVLQEKIIAPTGEGQAADTLPGEDTVFSEAEGHWTTAYQCSSSGLYDWQIKGDQLTFRDQQNSFDVERIVNLKGNTLFTVTVASFHDPRTPTEKVGTQWEYHFDRKDLVSVRNSSGSSFKLRKCS
jgi:hypothetical protein